jgi:hypothetical protein
MVPWSPLDEMVVLCEAGKQPSSAFSNTRYKRIAYKDINELFEKLNCKERRLRPEAAPFIPTAQRLATSKADSKKDGTSTPNEETEEKEAENVEAIIESIPTNSADDVPISPEFLEERNNAARRLLARYRRVVRSREKPTKEGIAAVRAKHIETCMEQAEKIEWTAKSVYRLIFRGPLPHALTCVDALLKGAMAEKKKLKDSRAKAEHEALEQSMSSQTKIV